MPMQAEEITRRAVEALEELKGADIRIMDVRAMTTVTDAMVVVSGHSNRQVRALAENVVRRAKAAGHAPMGIEGDNHGEWILVDLCDVVVHVMLPDVRDFYQLEKLWGGARADRRSSSG